MRPNLLPAAVLLGVLAIPTGWRLAPAQSLDGSCRPAVPAAKPEEAAETLPIVTQSNEPLRPPNPEQCDRPLPINLATALRLADARPLIIEAARAAIETENGLYQQAKVLWLPTVYVGADYLRHDGGQQNFITAQPIVGTRSQFLAGGGAAAVFALTDAIYAPLAERQLLEARHIQVQVAKNDALLLVARAYFDVQQARGNLAGIQDCLAKARELVRRVGALGKGLAPAIEVERVNTLLEYLEQQAALARRQWLISSARLTRVLRLAPAVVVVPLEPPHLQVTLISPKQDVDTLIPIGLTNRPELAAQQAVVQATLVRLKQEKMRPCSRAWCCTPTRIRTNTWGSSRSAPAGAARRRGPAAAIGTLRWSGSSATSAWATAG